MGGGSAAPPGTARRRESSRGSGSGGSARPTTAGPARDPTADSFGCPGERAAPRGATCGWKQRGFPAGILFLLVLASAGATGLATALPVPPPLLAGFGRAGPPSRNSVSGVGAVIFLGMLGDCAGTDNPPLPDTGTAPPVPPPLFAGLGRAGHHSRIIFVSTICGVGAVLFFFGPRLSVWVMTRLAPPELESVYVMHFSACGFLF